MNIEIEMAGRLLSLGLENSESAKYFAGFLKSMDSPVCEISLRPQDYHCPPLSEPDEPLTPYTEFMLLMPQVSRYLLRKEAVLIHGAAFCWHKRAWLITAPSGIGKTTHYYHWKRLWKGEVDVINGDKPLLERRESGVFWLHPSPWTGKEGDTGSISGQLGGIIILKQATENRICRIDARKSVLEMLNALILYYEEPEDVILAGKMLDELLRNVPVWLLENKGDEESAILANHELSCFMKEII